MIRYIELVEVLEAHRRILGQFGGAEGVRDLARINAAVAAPKQTFDGNDLYQTIPDKAAALGYFLANGHGFVDGNKRTAQHVMEVFLHYNGYRLTASAGELEQMLYIVAGENPDARINRAEFAAWVTAHVIEI